ncbi:MAG: hypothetical protein M3Q70_03760 [bacterium]|nr:hypothetical protein [bacterium]
MSSRTHRPEIDALNAETGRRLGHGQDNLVHALELPDYAQTLLNRGDWVLKVSHKNIGAEHKRDWSQDPVESAISGTRYKKEKYEVLKHFLGNFIPESLFLVAGVGTQAGGQRPAEVTIQRRVPQYTISDLHESQKDDPRLSQNILELMTRLQYMYSVVGEANGRSANRASIDVKLDLGGVSDFVRSKPLSSKFEINDAAKTVRKNNSPNLLVDPESMQLYCIDFDQGDWNPGMSGTKETVFAIDSHRHTLARNTGKSALAGFLTAG